MSGDWDELMNKIIIEDPSRQQHPETEKEKSSTQLINVIF